MSDEANIDAYFERIGFAGSIAPELSTLEQLHALHPAAIPFENLDPLLELPIRLDLRNLEQKLLFEKRGGYCFEQNLLFKAELEALGYDVTGLAARVLWGRDGDEADRPLSHMVLVVDLAGTPYLCDVGFGSATLTAPLKLRPDLEQETPHGLFRLLGGDPDWRLELRVGEDWRPVYVFDTTERSFEDYVGYSDRVAADPHFHDNLIAARSEKTRRVGLNNLDLRITPLEGAPELRRLQSVAEIKETLTGLFGIALPSTDRLDPALEKLLAREQGG